MVTSERLAQFLRVELSCNRSRAHQVTKQHRQIAPLASYPARLIRRRLEDGLPAGALSGVPQSAQNFAPSELSELQFKQRVDNRVSALSAEFLAGDSFCRALGAAHPMLSTRRAAPLRLSGRQCRSLR
jgi:hypothetical protein